MHMYYVLKTREDEWPGCWQGWGEARGVVTDFPIKITAIESGFSPNSRKGT